MKKWWQSKTIWTGAAAVLAGVGVYFETSSPENLLTAAVGLLMIVLRAVTDKPLGGQDGPPSAPPPSINVLAMVGLASLLFTCAAQAAPPRIALARASFGAGAGLMGYEAGGGETRADLGPHLAVNYSATSKLGLHVVPAYGLTHSLGSLRYGASLALAKSDELQVQTWAGVDGYGYFGGGRHDMEATRGWGPYLQAVRILSRNDEGAAEWGVILRAYSDFKNGPGIAVELRRQVAGGKPR